MSGENDHARRRLLWRSVSNVSFRKAPRGQGTSACVQRDGAKWAGMAFISRNWRTYSDLYLLKAILLLPMKAAQKRHFKSRIAKKRSVLYYARVPSLDVRGAVRLRYLRPLNARLYSGRQVSICVMLHVQDIAGVTDILTLLQNIPVTFDLFVTAPSELVPEVEALCLRYFEPRHFFVRASENQGMNFGPMLVQFRRWIGRYERLLHLHTGAMLQDDINPVRARQWVLQGLIGSPGVVNGILNAFEGEKELGVVSSPPPVGAQAWHYHWLASAGHAPALLGMLGVRGPAWQGILDFPLSGMFWARPRALAPLLQYPWSDTDFGADSAPPGKAMAQVIGRSIGQICGASSHLYAETDPDNDLIRVGTGEKGLGRYFALASAAMEDIRDNYSVVTIDFYDTLFTRLAVRPEDVQSYIGHMLAREGMLADAEAFLPLRKAAEQVARQRKGHGDVGLAEIYDAFTAVCDWPIESIFRALELERELEARVLIPREKIIAFVRALASTGQHRLVLISDTYMDTAFIRSVLVRHGLGDVFTEILCSSETGLRKDTGTVWPWVKANLGEGSDALVHIGDNELSDISVPRALGIPVFWLMNTAVVAKLRGCPMPSGWRRQESRWQAGILLGPLVARLGNDPFSPRTDEPLTFRSSKEFGYAILGPLAFAFMSWLIRSARRDGVEHLFFLARGAHFLHRIYGKIVQACPEIDFPDASYLFISRRVVLPAAFCVDPDPAMITAGAGGYDGTFGDMMLARLGIPLTAFPSAVARESVSLPQDRDRVTELIRSYHDVITTHAGIAAHMLRAYLKQEGFDEKERVAFVDLGYSATIQKAVQKTTGKPLFGYYFGTMPSAQDVRQLGGSASACFAEWQPDTPLPEIIKYNPLLEAIFAAPMGQVDDYETRDGRIAPVYDDNPTSGPAFRELELVAEGMQAYCLDLIRAYGSDVLTMDLDPAEATQPILKVIHGWVEIPEALRRAMVVDDAFCGHGNLNVLSIIEMIMKEN